MAYGGHFHGSLQVRVRLFTTFESENFLIITPVNPGVVDAASQRVGDVEGDSDFGVVGIGIIFIIVVSLSPLDRAFSGGGSVKF